MNTVTELEVELNQAFHEDEINGRIFQATTEKDFDNYVENRVGSCEYQGEFYIKAHQDDDWVVMKSNDSGGWDQQ